MKIAIIGAGPAGLSAAEALRGLGYDDIEIFEKTAQPGGQAKSFSYQRKDGSVLRYDVGSFQPVASKRLNAYIENFQLHRNPPLNVIECGLDKEFFFESKDLKSVLSVVGFKYLFSDLLRITFFLFKYRKVSAPGFNELPYMDELASPFLDWVKVKKFKNEGVVHLFKVLASTAGSLLKVDEISTASMFKYLYQTLHRPILYINTKIRPLEEGYQTLWDNVAEKYTIHYSQKISSVKRNLDEKIVISLKNSETREFDLISSL